MPRDRRYMGWIRLRRPGGVRVWAQATRLQATRREARAELAEIVPMNTSEEVEESRVVLPEGVPPVREGTRDAA